MPMSDNLRSTLDAAKDSLKASTNALDEMIFTDPETSKKNRMVLIHLNDTLRQQMLLNEFIGILIDELETKNKIAMDYAVK